MRKAWAARAAAWVVLVTAACGNHRPAAQTPVTTRGNRERAPDAGLAADANHAVRDGGRVDGGLEPPVESPDAGAPPDAGADRTEIAVRRGRRVYLRICERCHTHTERPLDGLRLPRGRLRRQVRQGSGQMRPIGRGRLSARELDLLIVYLSTRGTVR